MKRVAAGKKKPAFTLICLNAVQEEIGGNGAMMATYRLKPDLCVCLDVTHATDTPGLDYAKFGKVTLGGGPSLSHGSSNHPLVVERLMKVAKSEKIEVQHEATSRFSGTDTDEIFRTRVGVPSAGVYRERINTDSVHYGGSNVGAPFGEITAQVAEKLKAFNATAGGSSRKVGRFRMLTSPPSLDTGEITDKGYVNQRATQDSRAAEVASPDAAESATEATPTAASTAPAACHS